MKSKYHIIWLLLLPLPVLASLSSRLDKLQTYQANFLQQTYNAAGKVVQSGRGQVYLQRPGLFRWQTNLPTQQIIIAKNNTLWTYDVDLEQVTKQPLTSANDLATQILVGNSKRALNSFSIKQLDSNSYLLHPKAKSNLSAIKLRFSGNVMVTMEVKNSFDQLTKFKFSKIRFNKSISASKFSTRWPKSVDVVEAQ